MELEANIHPSNRIHMQMHTNLLNRFPARLSDTFKNAESDWGSEEELRWDYTFVGEYEIWEGSWIGEISD